MGTNRIEPYLLYEDVPAAIDWLTKAFGFRRRHWREDHPAAPG